MDGTVTLNKNFDDEYIQQGNNNINNLGNNGVSMMATKNGDE